MSPDYDPRRSRPRPVSAPDPEAAPVEALFGPEPDAANADADADPTPGTPPRPAPGTLRGAPSFTWQLAPLVVLMTLVGAVLWWLTRRRR